MNPEACNINFPADLPDNCFTDDGYPRRFKMGTYAGDKRMTQEQIAEFGKWLKENEPSQRLNEKDEENDYWELFAYRIVAKLGV